MAAPQTKTHQKFSLEIMKGPHAGGSFTFDKPSVSFGRGAENDVVLANDPRISRQHAEIKSSGDEYYIVNLSQKNFVLVNGIRVQSEKLEGEAVIQIGESEIKFKPDRPLVAKNTTPSFAGVKPATAPTMPPPSMPQAQGFGAPQTYQAPHMPGPSMPPPQAPNFGGGSGESILQNKRVRFYGIIVIVALVGWYLMSSGKKVKKDPNAIRMSDQVLLDMQNSDDAKKKFAERKEKFSTVEFSRAQENFIKGFRDFQQGQYARAREAFQVVLNLDPENDLAKRYLQLSKIKFDENVKFSMIQGSRYREKKNWRKCQSSFFNVMTMLQSRKDDPTYIEAKRYYEECSLAGEGRF